MRSQSVQPRQRAWSVWCAKKLHAALSGSRRAICGMPAPPEAIRRITSPRNASRDTSRRGAAAATWCSGGVAGSVAAGGGFGGGASGVTGGDGSEKRPEWGRPCECAAAGATQATSTYTEVLRQNTTDGGVTAADETRQRLSTFADAAR